MPQRPAILKQDLEPDGQAWYCEFRPQPPRSRVSSLSGTALSTLSRAQIIEKAEGASQLGVPKAASAVSLSRPAGDSASSVISWSPPVRPRSYMHYPEWVPMDPIGGQPEHWRESQYNYIFRGASGLPDAEQKLP